VLCRLNIENTDRETMALIGHELRHAIEVLSDARVTNRASCTSSIGSILTPLILPACLKPSRQLRTGNAVADEIRRFQRANDAEPFTAAAGMLADHEP
jgi:hypothetical protein